MPESNRLTTAADPLREVNDQIRRLVGGLAEDISGRFVCECDDPDCLEAVVIPIREYDERRLSMSPRIVAHEAG
jgi:hypothetical protein